MKILKMIKYFILLICLSFSAFAKTESILISDESEKSNISIRMDIDDLYVRFSKCNAEDLTKCIEMGEIAIDVLENRIALNNGQVETNRLIVTVGTSAMVLGILGSLANDPMVAGASSGLAVGGVLCIASWLGVKMIDKNTNALGTSSKLDEILGSGREQCRLGLSDGKYKVDSLDSFIVGLEIILE